MIDIRTLRIGSHVLANGVVATVERLEMRRWPDGKKRPWGYFHGKVNGEYRECGSFLDVDNVQPIPITPELLTELGFENVPGSDMWTLERDRRVQIGCIRNGLWTITQYMREYSLIMRGVVRSLHEAEAFLALHNVELIKE